MGNDGSFTEVADGPPASEPAPGESSGLSTKKTSAARGGRAWANVSEIWSVNSTAGRTYWAVLIILMAAAFAIDLAVPLGVAGGLPYIAAVLISLCLPGTRPVILTVPLVSALMIAGYFYSPFGGDHGHVLSDRLLTLGVVLFTAGLANWVTNAIQSVANERSVLAELSRVISSSGDITAVFPAFAEHVKSLVMFDRIVVAVVDWEREVITDRYVSGISVAGDEASTEIPLDEYEFLGILERGESRVLSEREMVTLAGRYQNAAIRHEAGLKSVIFVPMKSENQTIGALTLRSKTDDTYSSRDLALAEQVAAQIAGAVANQELRKVAEEEAWRRAVLAEIGRIVSSEPNLEGAYPRFAEVLRTLIRADRIVIRLVAPGCEMFTHDFVDGVSGADGGMGASNPLTGTTTREAIGSRESLVLNEQNRMALAERFPHLKKAFAKGLISGVSVPLISSDRVIGVLHVGATEEDAYGPREVDLIEEVASQIASAVANTHLYRATRREAEERSVLAELSKIISSAPNIGEVYEQFAECVRRVIPLDRLVICLAAPDDPSVWSHAYVSGRDVHGLRPGVRYARADSAAPLFDSDRAPTLLDQEILAKVPTWEKNSRNARSVGLESAMVAPLVWGDRVIGSLNFWSALPDAYAAVELAIAGRIADQIAGAVVNAEARRGAEEAHAALEASEKNYRDLVESSHDLIWRCDAAGRFTYLNPACERIYGYTVEEMLGRPFTDFEPPEIATRDIEEFSRHLAGGSVIDYETCHIAKSGEELTLLFNAFPVTDSDGKIVGTRGTARDITGERKAQAGLRVRGAAVEASGDAMIVSDHNGVITLVNSAAADMFQRSREELAGSPVSVLIPEEHREAHEAGIGRAREGGASHILGTLVEIEGLRADGSCFPIELRISRIKGGRSAGFVATIRDITERKKLEAMLRARNEALAESDARYRDLYDNAPDMYASVDAATGNIVECNQTLLSVLGCRRDELVGKPVFDLYAPDSLPEARTLFRRFRKSGVISDSELKMQRKDGSVIDVSLNVSAVRDTDGNIVRSRSTMHDITERKRAGEELRIRIAALDAADDAVIIADTDGRIEYVNEAFTALTGYSNEDVIGNNPRVLKSGRQDGSYYADLWTTVKAGRVWNGTLINRRKDGSEYPEEMSISPVEDDNGKVVRFIAIKRDVSERLRMEAERAAAQVLEAEHRELQRVNKARSEFLSTVSHELRTPLTAMLAFSEILRHNREENLTPRQLKQLKYISKGGRRLNELIEDLLDVSRSETGRFKLELAPFDIREVVEEVAHLCRSVFDERGQTLNVANLHESIWINADRARVMQVFNNLLTNAAKYSPDGTAVEMTVAADHDAVQVTVRDHGIGISADDQQRLFVPFFRVNNEETRRESGTGLGLVIVKTIVELHGGHIELESRQGVGTTVRTMLPGILAGPPEDPPATDTRLAITRSRLEELAE